MNPNPFLILDLRRARALKEAFQNYHALRAGELIDDLDRVVTELHADLDALAQEHGWLL